MPRSYASCGIMPSGTTGWCRYSRTGHLPGRYGSVAPEYHIELRERPAMVWDFHSLLLAIQMMFSFMLVDETATLSCAPTAIRHSLQRMRIPIAVGNVKVIIKSGELKM